MPRDPKRPETPKKMNTMFGQHMKKLYPSYFASYCEDPSVTKNALPTLARIHSSLSHP